MKPVSIVVTVEDENAKQAQMILNIVNQDVLSDLAVFLEIARLFQLHVDNQIDGRIVACGIIFDVPLDASLSTVAASGSRVHRAGKFVMKTNDGWYCQTRIPAYDENLIDSTSKMIDTTNPVVAAFISDLENGIDVGGTSYSVVDRRNYDVVEVSKAVKDYARSRSS